MDRNSRFIKSALIYAIGTIIPRLSHFILIPLYTTYFSTSEYGIFDLYINYISIFIPIATLELQQATFRYLLETGNSEEKKYNTIISTSIIGILPPILILSFCAYMPLLNLNSEYALFLYLNFVLSTIIEMLRMITRGLKNNTLFSMSAIVQSVLTIVFMFILLRLLDFGVKGALIANIVVLALTSFVILVGSGCIKYVHYRDFDKEMLKSMLNYSLPIVPTAICLWFLALSNRVIISNTIGPSASGIYAVANRIPQIIGMGVTVFNLSWQESAILASKDHDANLYYSEMYRALVKFIFSITLFVVSFSPFLFFTIVNNKFNSAFIHTLLLILAYYFNCCSTFFEGLYLAYFETRISCFSIFVAALINLLFIFTTIDYLGIYAASLATLFSYAFLYFFRCFDMNKRHHINVFVRDNLVYLLLISLMLYLVYDGSFLCRVLLLILSCSYFFYSNRLFLFKLILLLKK